MNSTAATLVVKLDQLDKRVTSIDAKIDRIELKLAALDTKISDRFGDLIKWSFVFWCSAVFAVALLARVLP